MTIRLSYAFDENAGLTFSPTVGTAVGTLSSVEKWVVGKNGSAIGMNGTEAYATITGAPILDLSTWDEFTLMIDCNPDVATGTQSLLVFHDSEEDFMGIQRNPDGELVVWVTSLIENTEEVFASSTYSNVAIVLDGTTASVVLEGVLVHSFAFTGTLPDLTEVELTRASWGSLGGAVDNMRVADHAMTVAEIQELMNVPVGGEPEPEEPTPLDTPVVTADSFVDPTVISGTDGKVTVSWPPVANSVSYDAMIAPGSNPDQGDFTIVQAGVTSPHDFEDLSSGTRAYGIIARAE